MKRSNDYIGKNCHFKCNCCIMIRKVMFREDCVRFVFLARAGLSIAFILTSDTLLVCHSQQEGTVSQFCTCNGYTHNL